MTAAQIALGDREAPAYTATDSVPEGCYWWTDPDGDLSLTPGCMARIQDPDAECTCEKLVARLARVERRLREAQERERYAATWWTALREAVEAHPDRASILADAHRRAGR
ncbi:hypothetical protein [Actinacidiphila sp. ITFR-21]|uniref:hypothetical protein n=1 Tax=Actinacidiphila sp. ITFR-21 TaxID=3075199 RepID=UPI00288B7AAE|nr:hypothetical protein [Streptomyces sp. ITFR-21]WNI19211.1 hypothetical protein RLT57_29150 [Streptomyces sp. ITFR-21]